MKPVEESADGHTLPDAELPDLADPDLACWAGGEALAPPDLSDLPAWEPDALPEAPPTFAWEGPVEEPPVVGAAEEAPAPEQAADATDAVTDSDELPPWDVADAPAPDWETAEVEPPPPFEETPPDHAVEDPSAAPLPPADLAGPPCDAARREDEGARSPHADEDGARRQDRLARLKELAARLWTAAPRTDAAGEPHLICALGREEFALPLKRVREVQRLPAVTPVPHLPGWLLGVTNRRGDVLSVVDLAAFLGLPPGPPSPGRRLVVVQAAGDGLTTGLVVDAVRGLRALAADAIEPPALAGTPHMRGACRYGDASTVVLDLDDLLRSPRLLQPELEESDARAAETAHALLS